MSDDYLLLLSGILEYRDSSTHIVKVYILIISSTHRSEWPTDKAMSAWPFVRKHKYIDRKEYIPNLVTIYLVTEIVELKHLFLVGTN